MITPWWVWVSIGWFSGCAWTWLGIKLLKSEPAQGRKTG
jgi:hypothetical protein